MKQKQNIDPEKVKLGEFESKLNIMKPTDREVIWVLGENSKEFIEPKFGWCRVICGGDIKLKKSSICQAQRKGSLMTMEKLQHLMGSTMKYWKK